MINEQLQIKNDQGETLKAGCLIVNDEGKILLVTSAGRKFWSFPKGHSEPGETLKKTAIREVLEETGYDVKIIRRLPDAVYNHTKTGEPIRVALFRAKPLQKSHQPEPKTKAAWFSLSEARKILYPNLVTFIDPQTTGLLF